MDNRKYKGAGIGVERMNAILSLIKDKPMHISEIEKRLSLCRRACGDYIAHLLEMGKIFLADAGRDKRFKFYGAVSGATLIPAPKADLSQSRKEEKHKTGQKPKKSPSVAVPCVRSAPAQDVGIKRDPLVAALFGECAQKPATDVQ